MKPLPPLSGIERLLIVKTSSLGDVIHALPAVQAIKDARPELKIDWVVRRRCADLLQGCPYIDCLHVIPDRPGLRDLAKLRQTLRGARYPMALDMQGLALSGLIARLSGAPVRVGWDRNREQNARFLTHPIVPGRAAEVGVRHEVALLYGFPKALGVSVSEGEFPPQKYLADRAGLARWVGPADIQRPLVALNVGSARDYKRWPADRWAQLARALIQRGCSLVFVGDRQDAETIAAIRKTLPEAAPVWDTSGETSLRELANVLLHCDLVISGDTGPMHLAVAVGTPVVALFGATDPRRHGPYGGRNSVVSASGGATRKRPTREQGMAAMAQITPEMVLAAMKTRDAALCPK